MFDLEYDAKYMSWSWQESADATAYTVKWTYVGGQNDVGTMKKDTLNAGCNIDVHNNHLVNPIIESWAFVGGSITGTWNGYYPTVIDSSTGAIQEWKRFSLKFEKGILQAATW